LPGSLKNVNDHNDLAFGPVPAKRPAMNKIINKFNEGFEKFETWFNDKFGWFFTNGMKQIEEPRNNSGLNA
jgi:hypothetical protein